MADYKADSVTAIGVGSRGEVYLRFDGLPNPGPCGNNNDWVIIPTSASEAMKSLAISLYFTPRPISLTTNGCVGAYESVTLLYSPSA